MTRDQRGEPDLPPGPAKDLVDLFRRVRHARRLSGGQIAVRTGLSPGHISDVLRGWKAPSPDAAAKISAALGAGPDVTRRAVRLAEQLAELNRHNRSKMRDGLARAAAQAAPLAPPSAPGRTGPRAGAAVPGEPPPRRRSAGADADSASAVRSPKRESDQPELSGAPEHAGVAWPHRVGVVPPRAQCLQHRPEADALVAGLAAKVSSSGTTMILTPVLAGLGGVGKTQLAAACAEDLFAAGVIELLVWINAGSRAQIESGFAQAGFEITGIADPDTPRGAARFLAWLASTRRRWLVVLDDLVVPALLTGLWPPTRPGGRTIITTRRRDASLTGPDRQVLDVGLFSAAEAAGYLRARLADRPHLLDAPEALAADLGLLPLALAQAAAYLLDRELTCAQYRDRLADSRARLTSLLPEPDALPDAHAETVAATWSLSVDLADRLAPAGLARPLLELAAVLDPNGIPAAVFSTAAARGYLARARSCGDGEPAAGPSPETDNGPGQIDSDQARDGLHCLARLSLVTLDPASGARGVRIHALVQRAIRDGLSPDQIGRAVVAAADALADAWPPVEHDPGFGQALRASTDALAAHHPDALWTPAAHPVLLHAGRSLGDSGSAGAAAEYFERICATATRRLGPDHPDTLTARHELSHWRGEAGDAPAASAGFEELLADLLRIKGPDDRATLAARHERALWRGKEGDAAGAATAYEKLLADRLRVLGPGHQDTLTTRGNLAWWQGRSGDVDSAITGFEVLLADVLRILGPDHRHTLTTRHNLAYWRGHAGDPAGAAAGFEKLLADLMRTLGPDHPDTLNVRNSFAWWRGRAADVAGAAAMYEELLADRLRILGPDHRLTWVTRHNLAYWRGEANDLAGAVAAYTELLADRVRILGPDHPHTLNSRSEMARWLGKAGDPAAAAAVLAELLADRLRLLGPDDPDTLITRYNLACWRGEAGDPAGAAAALEELLADQVRLLGPDHADTLATRAEIARWRGATVVPPPTAVPPAAVPPASERETDDIP